MALLNMEEAARYIDPSGEKITKWTIWRLYKEKKLPCVQTGRRVFFRSESIEKWLAEQEQASIQKEAEPERGKLRVLR